MSATTSISTVNCANHNGHGFCHAHEYVDFFLQAGAREAGAREAEAREEEAKEAKQKKKQKQEKQEPEKQESEKKKQEKKWETWPEPPSHIPDPTPLHVLRKYTGTFCAPLSTDSAHRKSIDITLTRNLLYFQHLPDVDPKTTVSDKSKSKAAKGKPTVDSKGKITKKVAPPKKATKTTATAALVEAMANTENTPKQTNKTAAAATTLSEIMATKATAPKPMTPKAVASDPGTSTATSAPVPPSTPAIATAGIGADTTSMTPTAALSTSSNTTPCMLFLAVNGVPQVRVSGSTPEETAKHKEVQAMGLLYGKNELVAFDVKDGGMGGVRVKGELYVRVGASEKR